MRLPPKAVVLLAVGILCVLAGGVVLAFMEGGIGTVAGTVALATGTALTTMACVWAVTDTSRRRIIASLAELRQLVERNRVKESRHEYHQELAIEESAKIVREVHADTQYLLSRTHPRAGRRGAGRTARPHVLFVTSNGAGMGHLSRCAAILRGGQDLLTGSILTMSTAAGVVRDAGYDVTYFPSQSVSGLPSAKWRRALFDRLLAESVEREPDVVVFDGTWVYEPVSQVTERLGIPLVWMQRGTWREGTDTDQRRHPAAVCDLVIIPDEVYGPPHDADLSNPIVRRCPPISMFDPAAALTRTEARAALGLPEDGELVLIQVGGGNLGSSVDLTNFIAAQITETSERSIPVVVSSPLLSQSEMKLPERAEVIPPTYPLAQYLRAFDAAVTGAGYNSVVENTRCGLPTLLIPSTKTATDDQVRRAEFATESGLCLHAGDHELLVNEIGTLCQRVRQTASGEERRTHPWPDGARQVALILEEFIDEFSAKV